MHPINSRLLAWHTGRVAARIFFGLFSVALLLHWTVCVEEMHKSCVEHLARFLVNLRTGRVLDLLEFKNQASKCFAGNQQCPGVWNSFQFLGWDWSMHQRTHIWHFTQFICTAAFACISNLNYAHKMPRKSSWCIKMSKRTWKNSKTKHNSHVVLCWH